MKTVYNKDVYVTDNLEVNYFVYMHFDFDGYQPDKMDDLRKENINYKGSFRLNRMLP